MLGSFYIKLLDFESNENNYVTIFQLVAFKQ